MKRRMLLFSYQKCYTTKYGTNHLFSFFFLVNAEIVFIRKVI